MYDQAVTPDNVSTQPTQGQNQTSGTGGTFGTGNDTVPQTPMPQATSFTSYEPLQAAKLQSNAYTQGAQTIANSAKSSGGGGGIGGILGGIGSLFGAIFAQGGFVGDKVNGFAEGGHVGNDPSKKADMTIGYLVGAHHQQNYGGTPDTLEKAAQEIKQMLQQHLSGSQPQGFAQGGDVNQADDQLLQQAIASAVGLNPDQTTKAAQVPQAQTQPTEYIEPPNQQQMQQLNNQQSQSTPDQSNQQNLMNQIMPQFPPMMQQAQGGFMQHLAVGGPPIEQGMPMQAPPGMNDNDGDEPPLQPGQTFEGSGSVKGPGGPTDDLIPAKLSNGEFVMSAPAVQFFGVDKLNKMNEQGKQGFMQTIAQVQSNQGKPPSGAPAAMAGLPPQAQQSNPPQQQAKGGIMKPKGKNGYMGL